MPRGSLESIQPIKGYCTCDDTGQCQYCRAQQQRLATMISGTGERLVAGEEILKDHTDEPDFFSLSEQDLRIYELGQEELKRIKAKLNNWKFFADQAGKYQIPKLDAILAKKGDPRDLIKVQKLRDELSGAIADSF